MKDYKYWLVVIFNEKNDTHGICETWRSNNIKAIIKHLAESLDLVNTNGEVNEPNYDKIHQVLSNLVDEKFINDEYNRLSKNYKIYKEILEKFKNGCIFAKFQIDKKTTIRISSFI